MENPVINCQVFHGVLCSMINPMLMRKGKEEEEEDMECVNIFCIEYQFYAQPKAFMNPVEKRRL